MSAIDYLRRTAARGLVSYAASYHVTCPRCADILDQSTTVVQTQDNVEASITLCGRCYGRPIGSFRQGAVEVLDGRELFPQRSQRAWHYRSAD